MDALETLIREALAEHAHEAPPPDRLVVPPRSADRGRRRWPHVLLAAAAVAAVAIGVVVVRGGSSGNPPAAPTPIPTFAPIPPGMNEVSYHGITVQIPDNLRPRYDDCAAPRNVIDTVDWTLAPNCPVTIDIQDRRPGTLVRLAPYQNGRPDSMRIQHQPGVVETRNLPGPGVSVYVAAPTRAQVRAIFDTVRVTPVDRNGCAATRPALSDPPASDLLPGTPTAASECTYTLVPGSRAVAYLVRSLPVAADRLSRLVAAIDNLPAGSSGHAAELPGSVRYQFTYADGSVRTIDVTRGDDATVTDGQHVAHDPDNSIVGAFD
jgi:hypothetical protein